MKIAERYNIGDFGLRADPRYRVTFSLVDEKNWLPGWMPIYGKTLEELESDGFVIDWVTVRQLRQRCEANETAWRQAMAEAKSKISSLGESCPHINLVESLAQELEEQWDYGGGMSPMLPGVVMEGQKEREESSDQCLAEEILAGYSIVERSNYVAVSRRISWDKKPLFSTVYFKKEGEVGVIYAGEEEFSLAFVEELFQTRGRLAVADSRP